MPSLQIRELPNDLVRRLVLRAQRSHRSLAQQALSELTGSLGQGKGKERLALLARIEVEAAQMPATPGIRPPEARLREDRAR